MVVGASGLINFDSGKNNGLKWRLAEPSTSGITKFSAIPISSFSNVCIRSFQHVPNETGKLKPPALPEKRPFLYILTVVNFCFKLGR